MSNYWQRTLRSRTSRRRLMAASGAAAFSAAFLAACGGDDDDDGGGGGDASGLMAKVEDTTSKAKPGGTWVAPLPTENFLNMDPYGVAVGSAHAPWGYSRSRRNLSIGNLDANSGCGLAARWDTLASCTECASRAATSRGNFSITGEKRIRGAQRTARVTIRSSGASSRAFVGRLRPELR